MITWLEQNPTAAVGLALVLLGVVRGLFALFDRLLLILGDTLKTAVGKRKEPIEESPKNFFGIHEKGNGECRVTKETEQKLLELQWSSSEMATHLEKIAEQTVKGSVIQKQILENQSDIFQKLDNIPSRVREIMK